MEIPEGMTEQEVLKSINNVADGLAHKYCFGYLDIEDVKQEARIEGLIALKDYDPNKGAALETFLWMHVNWRLYNMRRNKFERLDKPCLDCPFNAYDPQRKKSQSQCTKYSNKDNCDIYYKWSKRNESKKNIMSPVGIQHVRDEEENNMKENDRLIEKLTYKNIVEKIDREIPKTLRSSWIKLKNDIKIKKADREKLLEFIIDLVGEE